MYWNITWFSPLLTFPRSSWNNPWTQQHQKPWSPSAAKRYLKYVAALWEIILYLTIGIWKGAGGGGGAFLLRDTPAWQQCPEAFQCYLSTFSNPQTAPFAQDDDVFFFNFSFPSYLYIFLHQGCTWLEKIAAGMCGAVIVPRAPISSAFISSFLCICSNAIHATGFALSKIFTQYLQNIYKILHLQIIGKKYLKNFI